MNTLLIAFLLNLCSTGASSDFFIKHPKNVVVNENQDATFECEYTPSPEKSAVTIVTFNYGDHFITGNRGVDEEYEVVNKPGYCALTIKKVSRKDDGSSFRCTIELMVGNEAPEFHHSLIAKLRVLNGDRIFFDSIDENKNGEIGENELGNAIQAVGEIFMADETIAILKEEDTGGNGAIDFEEFSEKGIDREYFDGIDENKNGQITFSELGSAVQAVAETAIDDEMKAILVEDTDGNGAIDFEEFAEKENEEQKVKTGETESCMREGEYCGSGGHEDCCEGLNCEIRSITIKKHVCIRSNLLDSKKAWNAITNWWKSRPSPLYRWDKWLG